jgi:monoamine oxidase
MSERTGHSDVLVLGAGMAGLSGAIELAHGGLSVTLLEARARVGGRILTEDVPGWTTPVELGAEFVHGRPTQLFELIEAFGLTRESSHAPHLRKAARGLDQGFGNFWRGIDEALESIHPDATDVSAAEFLSVSHLPADVARALAGYLEGFHAGELDRISMRSVVRQMSDDDAQQGRIRQGYGRLVDLMAKDVVSAGARIALKTRVSSVRWRPSSVVAVADGTEWHAKAVLVALPLSVLKAAASGGVSLDPEPPEVRRGLDALEMGQALRVVLRLRRSIGLLDTLPSGAFVHGIDAEFPTMWLGPNRHEAQVTTWCGGPRAMRLGERDARSIARAAMRSVAVGLDVSVEALDENLLGAHVHSFGSDPFSLGAYPYALAERDASGAFDPVERTLFFAGDYTVPEELGTVGIAVKTGVSAAREILDIFGR